MPPRKNVSYGAGAPSTLNAYTKKQTPMKLPGDSAAMTSAACLKPEYNGNIELDDEQISYVF